jgi:hypothetical protein
MARTIYGATLFKSPTKEVNFDGGIVIGKNSEVFTSGDPVTITSGFLLVAGATDTVYGVVQKTQTMVSTNQTGALVKPSVLVPDQSYEFLMGTNSDLAATSVGTFYKLTGTTGAVQVDVTSGAMTGTAIIVECTKVDPNGEGGSGSGSGLRQGLFRFVKLFNST